MASTPAFTNSAGMVSNLSDCPISALTGDSSSSRRLERGSSSGICVQSSIVLSSTVSWLYRSEKYSIHLLRISGSSMSHFPHLSCIVVDLSFPLWLSL